MVVGGVGVVVVVVVAACFTKNLSCAAPVHSQTEATGNLPSAAFQGNTPHQVVVVVVVVVVKDVVSVAGFTLNLKDNYAPEVLATIV